ncbi:TIGR03756 family integrating conjugative element protein [Pseudomonas sp. UBA1879]|uniref:TIGR03756 family integrating conjugative element protein n=1 Tax=Pseudomonas sp. UBA1879 TaxID=1947305 RepID=UPI0025F8F311|nr:TIGR03756 family integrating conjugative element protein [Pseudomonas sp. UBA1879]
MRPIRARLRPVALLVTMSASFSASAAITSAAIISSTLSPQCLEYKVVGICYWLLCTPLGCKIKTSTKVRHYVPDAVVAAYSNTGASPWVEMSGLGAANADAQAGGDGTTNHQNENNVIKFKEADVIGHPGGATFMKFASASGYACSGASLPLVPYFLSARDTIGWRYGVPEAAYPEALTPGLREVGSSLIANQWGNVYPRSGFVPQIDDYKAGALVAQRAADITTRPAQLHVYFPLLALPRPGYWPAGPVLESNPSTGRWQELTPVLSPGCAVFPSITPNVESHDGGYAWALWRPYSCCQRRGQTFLGSTGL